MNSKKGDEIKWMKVLEKRDDFFHGYFKEQYIQIEKEKEPVGLYTQFYIIVQGDGGYSYDGYWDDKEERGIDGAILEALKGSQLI